MMKIILFCACLLGGAVSAQAAASDWTQHVPKGWKLIGDVAEGDAAVLIIEQDDPAKRIRNDGLGADELNTNPRQLVFLTRNGTGYRASDRAKTFLPPEGEEDSPCLQDPLEEGGMTLRDGVLTINLGYWSSCGGWGTWKDSFKFRKEKGRYRLIGFDRLSYMRNGGTGEEISINYLTGRKKLTTGVEIFIPETGEAQPKKRVVWSRISSNRYYLDAMDRHECDGHEAAPSWCGY